MLMMMFITVHMPMDGQETLTRRLKLSYQDGVLRVTLRTWLLAAAACNGLYAAEGRSWFLSRSCKNEYGK